MTECKHPLSWDNRHVKHVEALRPPRVVSAFFHYHLLLVPMSTILSTTTGTTRAAHNSIVVLIQVRGEIAKLRGDGRVQSHGQFAAKIVEIVKELLCLVHLGGHSLGQTGFGGKVKLGRQQVLGQVDHWVAGIQLVGVGCAWRIEQRLGAQNLDGCRAIGDVEVAIAVLVDLVPNEASRAILEVVHKVLNDIVPFAGPSVLGCGKALAASGAVVPVLKDEAK